MNYFGWFQTFQPINLIFITDNFVYHLFMNVYKCNIPCDAWSNLIKIINISDANYLISRSFLFII